MKNTFYLNNDYRKTGNNLTASGKINYPGELLFPQLVLI